MKQKKFFLKKFHRKYIFLQNSLADFLHWRTTNFLKEKDSLFRTKNKNQTKHESFLFEQDKICLQEYWKSSETKKIRNAIQNINTTFDVYKSFENWEKAKKNTYSTSSKESIVSYLPMAKRNDKNQTNRINQKGKYDENRYKTLNSLPFQKKFKKFQNFQKGNSRFETLIPESDCFLNLNLFSFFTNRKFGQFFPKKKNFQQYWIFPLLGFVVLFSSTSFSKKPFREKENQNKFFFEKNANNIFSSDFENQQKKLFASTRFFDEKTNFDPFQKTIRFSYSDKFSQKTYRQLQKLEKTEYQNLCDFYLTFFKNSMANVFFDEKTNHLFQKSLVEISNKNFVFALQKNNLRKTLETKRNVLNWKWFSLNFPFLNFEQIAQFYNFFGFEIPEKAQFFFSKNKKSFFSEIQNTNKENTFCLSKTLKNQKFCFQVTPVSEFSKAGFLLNEYQRNFNFTVPYSNFGNNQNFEYCRQNSDFFLFNDSRMKKHNFLNTDVVFHFSAKNFLNNLEKEDLKFLNSLFFERFVSAKKQSQKTKESFDTQKNSDFNLTQKDSIFSFLDQNNQEMFETKYFDKNSRNLFFLQKWLQTQNFWQVYPKTKSSNQKTNQSLSESMGATLSTKKFDESKNLNHFKRTEKQRFQFQNFMNLDSLYLQKLVRAFQLHSKFEINKNLTEKIHFSNFSRFLELPQNSEIRKKNQKNLSKRDFSMQLLSEAKTRKKYNFSFKLKKQTFRFFVFQYYNRHSKNFYKQFLFKKNAFFLSSLFSESKSEKNKFEFFENLKKTLFLNNFIQNQFFSKKDFEKIESFNKISILEIPIFLDFARNSFEDQLIFQKKEKNGELQQSFYNKFGFVPFNFDSHEFFSENLTSQPSHLSSIYFHLLNSNNILRNFSVYTPNSQDNIEISKRKFFSFFGEKTRTKMNSIKSTLFCSKNNFFETICENTFKKLKTKFSWNSSKFEFFKKSFFIEKIKKEKPFVFQPNQSFPFVQYSKLQSFCLKSKKCKSFVLKQKQHFFVSNESKMDFQKYKRNFSNFRSRKFEKIFKAFSSSFNKEKIEDSFFDSNILVHNQSLKKHQISKDFYKLKTQYDSLFLQTLSKSLKSKVKNMNSIFFISSAKFQNLKTNFSFGRNSKAFESNLNFRQKPKNNSKILNNDFAFAINKDSIRPTVLLKRDGFIVVPKSKRIFDSKMKNLFGQNKQFFQNQHFYLSEISQKDENHLTLQRLEKEKAIQKKRRMKKQKLETRRRKKRKRFFPRPIWLRFHLYKKFLKIRHPEKFLGQNNISSVRLFFEKQKSYKNQFENFKTVSLVFPTILKTHSFKNFSSSNFVFSTPKNSFFSLNPSFEKKWKHVFSPSFLNNQKNRKQKKNVRLSKQIFETSKKCEYGNSMFVPKNSIFLKNQNEFEQAKIYRKNRQKWGLNWKSGFHEKIFYNKFPLSKNFRQTTNFFYGSENNPISQNREHYKISGEILSEFLRLSWKSYWFQMNFQPYTRQITQNFRKMQQIESHKYFSNFSVLNIFGNIRYPSIFEGRSPVFQSTSQDYFQNDLLLKKSLSKKFFWYCNIRDSLESKPILRDSLTAGNQMCLNFQKIQNFPEYNRILYSRVSEILKNFKSSETNDDLFTKESQKTFKIPKHKNESFSSNLSFFTKSALFYEHFNVPSQPSIPAFSMFSSLFNDTSIKPTGELPTLRALWALHQTNFYHFQEKNHVRNVWTLKKRTDSLKSLKGTKKAVHFFRKYSGFEKFNAPNLLKSFDSKQRFQSQQPQNESTRLVSRRKNNFFPQKLEKDKLLVLSTLNSGFQDFIQQLDAMSLEKFVNVQKKCAIFGMKTFQQNSKISLRYLKFHLLSKNQTEKNVFFSEFLKEKNKESVPFLFSNSKQFEKSILPFDTKKPNPQNSAKSSLNFWWSQKNGNNFGFLFASENKVVHDFVLPFSNISEFKRFKQLDSLNMEQNNFINQTNQFSPDTNSIFVSEQKTKKWFWIQTQFFWFGAIVFHMALFFSIFKLPEIRSVFKFTFVLSYKFLNGFFAIVFSIYNLFKKYTTKGTHVVKKIIQFSNSSLNSQKSFVPFQSNVLRNQELQKFVFFRTQYIQEKNFFNSFFFSLFSSRNFKTFALNKKKAQNLSFLNSNDLFIIKTSKNAFFEFFVRISEFSFVSSSQNRSYQKTEQLQKQQSFFISRKNYVRDFSVFKQISTGENSSQTVTSIFSLKKGQFLFSSALKKRQQNLFEINKNPLQKKSIRLFSEGSGKKLTHSSSLKNIPALSNTEKFVCKFALFLLLLGKSTTQTSYNVVHLSSNVSAKIFDLFEMLMFSIYKFLEKPAELMIEWIALIFLIEWSSDIATFIPDTFDVSFAKSSRKFLRPVRSGSLILSFLSSRHDVFIFPFSSYVGTFGPSVFFNSFAFFGYSNMLSFVFQKRVFYFFEHFSSVLTQPDMDIFIRQRKGMIFWDIWAEILLKAAEKYNVNIPSFVTLKEEQEVFIERLLQDQQFLKNLQVEKSTPGFFAFVFNSHKKQTQKKSLNGEIIQQNSLASFVENFLVKERPREFFDFAFRFKNKHVHQFILSSEIFPFDLSGSRNLPTNQLSVSNIFSHKTMNKTLLEKNPLFLLRKNKAKKLRFFQKQNRSFAQQLRILPSSFYAQEQKDSFVFENADRWACHQYGTYQGPETDLFVDIHPPKSLKHIQFFKYSEPAQYTLGSFICQIYSGIFSKQVAKNILVIGAPGTAKTLFIQALAGETEMKIITDNAYRYSMVQRGVAVGMKYLRDVFDALVLQTPCFFLMEHIHVIGSKRPLLISDDENMKGIQSSFGLDQQEVHETNQMIYQFTRHSISDYKRPYKGDFSMGIPTNFFIQNFYSKFVKNATSIFKNSQFAAGGVNFIDRNSPISPLPIDAIEHSLVSQGFAQKEKTDTSFQNSLSATFKKGVFDFQSRLQMSREQTFAPPATSPFTILMMKEQKKLKPKKIVQETSWGGLSTDQMISYQKENSSVRAKVAVLADMTMNLSRGKFDMITDLLVIIDSVRSNRGFVVFGTTHLPSLLDPALRRPGRFDETISLAQSPNFLNRFEILKNNFENSLTTLDFLDSSILTENFSELNLLNLITGTKLSLFHQYKYNSPVVQPFESSLATISSSKPDVLTQQTKQNFSSCFVNGETQNQHRKSISQIHPSKAFESFLKSSFFHEFYAQKRLFSTNKKQQLFDSSEQIYKYFLRNFKLFKYTFLPKGPSHILSLAYSKVGIFFAKSNLLTDPTAYIPLSLDTNILSGGLSRNQQFFGNTFYGSQEQQKLQLMVFLSGKISEFFIQKTTKRFVCRQTPQNKEKKSNFNDSLNSFDLFESPFELFNHKFSLLPFEKNRNVLTNIRADSASFDVLKTKPQNDFKKQNLRIEISYFKKQGIDGDNKNSDDVLNTSALQKTNFFWTAFGDDPSWRSATPFVFSIIQKRFLFTKNLLLAKMLFFDNKNQRKLPPSPPGSSILMPSKKYENLKRTENDFVQKARFSMNEKIQMHQQQRFLKQLYNIPVQQYFRSETIQNRKTFFSSSFQELAYLDSFTRRPSSSQFYQKKYFGIRHRFSNLNQWWNGFLPEHTTETTYLSDVDWRTMFTAKDRILFPSPSPLGKGKGKGKKIQKTSKIFEKNQKQFDFSEKPINQTFEFTMDFPDAEQYYNPRNRRWYFNRKFGKNIQNNSSHWLTFDMDLQYEIYYHYLMQTFHQTFKYFDENREIFDFFVFDLLRKGFLKEIDYLTTLSRFKNL